METKFGYEPWIMNPSKRRKQPVLLSKQGKGVVGDVVRGVRNVGRRVLCSSKTRPLFLGENHFPCHNFTGPGTQIEKRIERGDQPVDAVDAIAKAHDLEYYTIEKDKSLSKEQKAKLIQEADEKMLERLRSSPESLAKYAAQLGIGSKNALEKVASAILNKPISIYGGCAPPSVRRCGGGRTVSNPWLTHLKAFRADNPKMSLKDAMKAAKKTYKR